MLIRLLALCLSLPVGATVFQIQSIEEQMREADGIVLGHFLRSKAIQLDDGSIATQMFFKMNKEHGMQSDLFGMDEIIVHYPGGKLEDLHVKVDGTPEFVSGENVALMIKSRQDRYWGLNLGFGTFRIINYGKEKMVVNSLFPHDLKASQMKLADFERSVRAVKGSGLKVVMNAQYQSNSDENSSGRIPASLSEGKNRALASKTVEGENDEKPEFNNFWLIAFLALAGGVFRFNHRPQEK